MDEGIETPSLTASEQLSEMARVGLEIVNNAWVASRWPPKSTTGLHPEGFYSVYNKGGLFDELRAQLGDPMPRPSGDFNDASKTELAQNHPKFNPNDLKFS